MIILGLTMITGTIRFTYTIYWYLYSPTTKGKQEYLRDGAVIHGKNENIFCGCCVGQ
jgi:hypothetical protein